MSKLVICESWRTIIQVLLVNPSISTQLFVFMQKVFICTVRFNFIEAARLGVSFIDFRHWNATILYICPLNWFEKVVLLDLVNGEPLSTWRYNESSDQTFCSCRYFCYIYRLGSLRRSRLIIRYLAIRQVDVCAFQILLLLLCALRIFVGKAKLANLDPTLLLFLRVSERECWHTSKHLISKQTIQI